MERVTTILGEEQSSILVICPHGYDDPNTSIVTDQIVNDLGCYAVINNGWERADTFDYYKDKCNCNNVYHLQEDVVKEEFLEPIENYIAKIENLNLEPTIFIVHGVGNHIRKIHPDLEIIIGYGHGENTSSYTCSNSFKNLFNTQLKKQGFSVYDGKPGGKYSARSKANLAQYYRLWQKDNSVFTIQLEIVSALRSDETSAKKTGMLLAPAMHNVVEQRYDDPSAIECNWPQA